MNSGNRLKGNDEAADPGCAANGEPAAPEFTRINRRRSKKNAGRAFASAGVIHKRALPTLSVVANTIGVKSLTTVFGMGTGVTSSL